MGVVGVVCALWSCGAEKCPFGFGRTCVRFRAEERTEERTTPSGIRIVRRLSEGPDACCRPAPEGGESGGAQAFSDLAGRARGLSVN